MSFRCINCGDPNVQLDDAIVPVHSCGACVCARCYYRLADAEKRMSGGLRREVIAALPKE